MALRHLAVGSHFVCSKASTRSSVSMESIIYLSSVALTVTLMSAPQFFHSPRRRPGSRRQA